MRLTSVTVERELAPAESVAWMESTLHSGPSSRSSSALVVRIPLTAFTAKRVVSPVGDGG